MTPRGRSGLGAPRGRALCAAGLFSSLLEISPEAWAAMRPSEQQGPVKAGPGPHLGAPQSPMLLGRGGGVSAP